MGSYDFFWKIVSLSWLKLMQQWCRNFLLAKYLEKFWFKTLKVEMLLSNQIAGFFDHQHFWKESINVLDFLHGGSHQGKIASEATPFGLM